MQPIRSCIACRKRFNQCELIKITLSKQDEYTINILGASGRSNYLCKDINCINLCINKKLLNKKFKQNVPAEIYEALTKFI